MGIGLHTRPCCACQDQRVVALRGHASGENTTGLLDASEPEIRQDLHYPHGASPLREQCVPDMLVLFRYSVIPLECAALASIT